MMATEQHRRPTLGGRPTLIDVARHAGVSRATASRVIAGSTTVDATMTRAVQRAAQELGYQTNQTARSLRQGRTGSVAIIAASREFDGLTGPFTTLTLRGAVAELSAAAIQPVLLLEDGSTPERIATYLRLGHVDGAITILVHEISQIHHVLADQEIPVVYIGRPTGPEDPTMSYVDADNYGGARLATRALLQTGRRNTAILAGPADMQAATARIDGYRDELAEWGLKPGPMARGEFTMSTGASATARLLERCPHLDALFACSDLMGVGALRVLRGAGRAVPEDVSLVAFDDTAVASTANPPLTTVRQPLDEMGRHAARIVLTQIAGPGTATHEVLATSLIERESH